MQWTDDPHGGFTSGAPWLAANPNAATINARDQAARPDSVLGHCRALIAFRRGSADLREGDYRDIDPDHSQVFAYRRGERLLVLLNFGREAVLYRLPDTLVVEGVAFGQGGVEGQMVTLAGWMSMILAVREA
jgi:oligo-1,6-glucosidase